MSAAATSTATGVTIVIARGAESVDGCFDPTAAPGAAFTDAVTTYNSYTLTSATANFLSSDVGLSIQGAYIPPGTTIQSRISATQVTLSNNATGSATNVAIVIGRSGSAPLVPYVMHCHNIEHEDNDMMLRWGVLR